MKVILTLITLNFLSNLQAQQDPLTTQFWNNYVHFNPATSGFENKHHAAVTYREQWTNLSGAPVTILANYNMRIGTHHGLGVNYLHSTIGFQKENDVNVNYNYQINFDTLKGHTLSFGIGLGFAHTVINEFIIIPGEDEILQNKYVSINPNLNLGVAYKIYDFFVGIGVTHLTEGAFTNAYYLPRNYYLMGSYNFHLSKSFTLKPQFQLQTDDVKISANLNLMAMMREQFWFGFGYRSSDAVIGMVGWDIKKKIRIGYSYDYTLNHLSKISRGSHEVVLGLMIK